MDIDQESAKKYLNQNKKLLICVKTYNKIQKNMKKDMISKQKKVNMKYLREFKDQKIYGKDNIRKLFQIQMQI